MSDEITELTAKYTYGTWRAQRGWKPLHVTKAEGVYFWDVSGKRYLDFNSMVMCSNIGHGDPRVIEAITDQAHELVFAGPGMATKPRALLGKLLSEITPRGLLKAM